MEILLAILVCSLMELGNSARLCMQRLVCQEGRARQDGTIQPWLAVSFILSDEIKDIVMEGWQ